MAARFLPNNPTALLALSLPTNNLKPTLEAIITNCPPQPSYPPSNLHGLWAGPTGLAYLFLHVSAYSPKLVIADRLPLDWAHQYLQGDRGAGLTIHPPRYGLNCEKLSFEAVRAAVTKDLNHVKLFVNSVTTIFLTSSAGGSSSSSSNDIPDELLHGRAGALYMLRLVRHWVPNSAPLVERAIVLLTEKMVAGRGEWNFRGRRYIGAVHGEVGIITQLVLTTPPLGARFEGRLGELLDMQMEDGNWPTRVGGTGSELVQFCHGAAGFLFSLFSLRMFFPRLEGRIDEAIRRGRELVWREGILRKEPSICHGILGNGLTLPPGPERDHFLAMATPEKMAEMKKQDNTLFEEADYGHSYSTLMSYAPSAAWTWMVCGKEFPKVLIYNDI